MPFATAAPVFTSRAVVVGGPQWRAAIGANLRGCGVDVTDVENVTDVAPFVDHFDIAFVEIAHTDPLHTVTRLWWVQRDLPAVLCGDDCAADFNRAASDAGLVVVNPAVPSVERLRALTGILTGPLRRQTADRSREVAQAMAALSALSVDTLDRAVSSGEAAAEIIRALFRADVVTLLVASENGLRTVVSVGADSEAVALDTAVDSPVDSVMKTGIARLMVGESDRSALNLTSSDPTTSASMLVPVVGQQTGTRAVLVVSRRGLHVLYTPHELELCLVMATMIGQLLARDDGAREARRLQQRLVTAERLTVLGELAAGVVHDVAAPLTIVRGNMEVLIGYLADVRPLLEEGEEAVPGVSDILDDLPALLCESYEGLTTACNVIAQMKRVVRVGTIARDEAVDVGATVDSAIRMLRSRVPTPVAVIANERCLVRGVAIELLQVVTNLIANANDTCIERATRAQTRREYFRPRIDVAVRRRGDDVVISVGDNGMGMSAEVEARLWDPLFTTKPSGIGTGLGMPVVKRLVREHGGRIEVSSIVDEGTTFEVMLPVLRAPTAPTPAA